MSINRVVISGNLTRDPDMRATQGGSAVMNFGVAVNGRTKDAAGNWTDRADFVDCVMFGNRAESVSRYLSKGSKVAIEGRLRYSSWERDGQKRSKLEVVVDEIEFLSRADGAQGGSYGAPAQAAQPAYQAPAPQAYAPAQGAQAAYADVYSDDIPF